MERPGERIDRCLALTQHIAASLKRHVQPGNHLTVGYSGGLDSSLLLHLLAEMRESAGFRLAAVHIHHGLSPHADAWALHCAETCRQLAVPLATHRVEVRPAGEGLEAAARSARYRIYARLDTDVLLLAHHQDDQAETLLLQLLRGAGLKGLAAMPEARRMDEKLLLLRPLLATRRSEIEACAAQRGLAWINDASNDDQSLARNALRHGVLPGLIERFPAARTTLASAARQFAEAAALLDMLADLDARAALTGGSLDVVALQTLPEVRARNLLRRFLEQSGAEIQQGQLHEALRQLLDARRDAQVRIVFGADSGQLVLRRYRQTALLVREASTRERVSSGSVTWQGEASMNLGDAGVLYFQAAVGKGLPLTPGKVSIRRRQGGERLRTGPGRPRRTLKNLLREARIPAWRRENLPLVYVGDDLVWAAGIGADSDYLVKADASGWLISWQEPPHTEAQALR